MRRRRLLVLAGVALAAAVIGSVALEVHAYRQKVARGRLIDRAHFDELGAGMRYTEVVAILGGPPGDVRTESVRYYEPDASYFRFRAGPGGRCERWSGNDGQILVAFDSQGVVQLLDFAPGHRTSPPPLAERVRDRLRSHGL